MFHRLGHLNSVNVSKGQKVRRGDLIGKMGTSGNSKTSHLHYDIFKAEPKSFKEYVIGWKKEDVEKTYEDPRPYLVDDFPTKNDHYGWRWLQEADYSGKKAFHPGIDLNGPGAGNADMNQPVYAPVDGEVVYAYGGPNYNKGWGRMVVIKEETDTLKTEIEIKDKALEAVGAKIALLKQDFEYCQIEKEKNSEYIRTLQLEISELKEAVEICNDARKYSEEALNREKTGNINLSLKKEPEILKRFKSGGWIAIAGGISFVLSEIIANIDYLSISPEWKSVLILVGTAIISQITKLLNK